MKEPKESLFEQIGGSGAVKSVVTNFYTRVLADDALARWFEGIDLPRLKAHQRAFITMALDGPTKYEGRELATAHAGMAITDLAFDLMLTHLEFSLADVGVADDVAAQVLARLEARRAEIVTR